MGAPETISYHGADDVRRPIPAIILVIQSIFSLLEQWISKK